MDDEFLPVHEIARRLGVSPRTIRRWIKARRIPCRRCGPKLLRVSWTRLLAVLDRPLELQGGADAAGSRSGA